MSLPTEPVNFGRDCPTINPNQPLLPSDLYLVGPPLLNFDHFPYAIAMAHQLTIEQLNGADRMPPWLNKAFLTSKKEYNSIYKENGTWFLHNIYQTLVLEEEDWVLNGNGRLSSCKSKDFFLRCRRVVLGADMEEYRRLFATIPQQDKFLTYAEQFRKTALDVVRNSDLSPKTVAQGVIDHVYPNKSGYADINCTLYHVFRTIGLVFKIPTAEDYETGYEKRILTFTDTFWEEDFIASYKRLASFKHADGSYFPLCYPIA